MESDVLPLRSVNNRQKIQLRRPTLVDKYHLEPQKDEYLVIAEVTRESVEKDEYIDSSGGMDAIRREGELLESLASCLRIFTAMKPHMRIAKIEWEYSGRNIGNVARVQEPKYIDWRDMQYAWDLPKEDVNLAYLSRNQMGEFSKFWKRFIRVLTDGQFQYVINRYNEGLIASRPNDQFRHTFESLQKLIPGSELHKVKQRTVGLLYGIRTTRKSSLQNSNNKLNQFTGSPTRKSIYNFMDVAVECRNSAYHESSDPYTSKSMKKMKEYFENLSNLSDYSEIEFENERWKAWFIDRLIEVTRQSIRYAILSEEYPNREKWEKTLDNSVVFGNRPVPNPPEWTKVGAPNF
jgi:hypothetical protein